LNLTPSFEKVFCRSDSVDVKTIRPFCAVLKRGFDSPTISCFGHGERVLWTEALSQASRAELKETRKIDANDYSYDKGDRDCYCVHVNELPLVKAWFRAGDAPIAKPQTGSKRRRPMNWANTGGSSGDPAKAQHRSDQRDDKKSKWPAQHDTSRQKRRTYGSRFLGSN